MNMSQNYEQPLIQKESSNIQICYKSLNIIADQTKPKEKYILKDLHGQISPFSFLAILGPTGSGKTTLLNFLSGRLVSSNLNIQGELYVNGKSVQSIEKYAQHIAYVMQDDVLMATMTPKQCFEFSANIRLNVSKEKKEQIVQNLISELGLEDCQNTRVGNNIIKGISGGERKRTSIGVQLITNPSVLFLDQPTTGLDSTTALKVIMMLKELAKKGKTIVSTIHQPSSQLLVEFDKLMLLVQGKCIYNGQIKQAQGYFERMNFKCPDLMNEAQYYLSLMNKEGMMIQMLQKDQKDINDINSEQLQQKFQKRIQTFLTQFQKSQMVSLQPQFRQQVVAIEDKQVGFFTQFGLIFQRSILTQVRNPMDFFLKLVQNIFTALICILVYGKLNYQLQFSSIQNRNGIIFFMISLGVFGGIQGTLAVFSGQKPLFLRQRFNKSYSTMAYFWGRCLATLPFDLIYPTVSISIIYFATNLNHNQAYKFPLAILLVNLVFWAASGFGLFYSAVIPKLEVAMALVPLLIIPFMMLCGFFIPLDKVPKIFYPIQYLSPFRYGFQALMFNEYIGLHQLQPLNPLQPSNTLNLQPDSAISNGLVLLGMGFIMRGLAFIAMYFISNPKRLKLKLVEQ